MAQAGLILFNMNPTPPPLHPPPLHSSPLSYYLSSPPPPLGVQEVKRRRSERVFSVKVTDLTSVKLAKIGKDNFRSCL